VTGVEIALVLALVAAGAMVQGCVGIGLGLVAAPGLVAIDPAFAPGPILIVGVIVGTRHIIVERPHADWPALRNCAIGLPIGLAAALAVLAVVDDRTMKILVGVTTALAATAILVGRTVQRRRATEIGAGATCTFAAVTAGLPGPPLVVVFSSMPPNTMRFTTSAFISSIAVVSAAALPASGNFGTHELGLLALLVPGAVAGLGIARFARPLLSGPRFRTAILIIAILGGLVLAVRSW